MKTKSLYLNSSALVVALALTATSAQAINLTTTTDAFGLANTLFLNIGGVTVNDADLVVGSQTATYQNPQGTFGLPNVGIAMSTGNVANYGTTDGPGFIPGDDGDFDEGEEGFEPEVAVNGPGQVTALNAAAPAPVPLTPGELLAPITGQPAENHFDIVQLDIGFFAPDNVDGVTFFAAFGSNEWPTFVGTGFIDGFGLIALASLTPMIFVMIYGMVKS